MRLLNMLRKDTDKYLSHFLKYKKNSNVCLEKKVDIKTPKDFKKNESKVKNIKKDTYPEFNKEGFPWE